MKLYTSVGPNPRVVALFLAEKGLAVPTETVDIIAGANRQPDFMARNPSGHTPLLELDDGSCLAESLAICEYLEELHPTPSLLGTTPEARAETRMWLRRIDLGYVQPSVFAFRGGPGLPLFQNRMVCVPEAVAGMRKVGDEGLALIDRQLGHGDYVCGDRFSLADILLAAFYDFAGSVGMAVDPRFAHIAAWRGRVAQRPAFAAA
jgi:glutathione S-transferase